MNREQFILKAARLHNLLCYRRYDHERPKAQREYQRLLLAREWLGVRIQDVYRRAREIRTEVIRGEANA